MANAKCRSAVADNFGLARFSPMIDPKGRKLQLPSNFNLPQFFIFYHSLISLFACISCRFASAQLNMADIQDLLARLGPPSETRESPSSYHQPSVSSPIASPSPTGPQPHHPSAVIVSPPSHSCPFSAFTNTDKSCSTESKYIRSE